METRKRIASISILTLILMVPAALAAGPAGEFKAGGNGFQLQPKANLGIVGYELIVAGPNGFAWKATFKPGELPSFYSADLADGAYSYSLMEIPFKRLNAKRPASSASREPAMHGNFSVKGGSLVDSSLVEGGFTKDQQILDDLIVDGSACIGLDCVNGESFGFDTLRLKENNLRIRAFDTSTSASFPTRDWQITFNETTNGGAEKFSIDDIDGGRTPFTIRAGAPSNSLFVSAAGRIGIGTNVPVVNLHVKTGNTPTLRLEQDGSSGFTAHTWDVAGNEANFFIRDVTSGSTLPLRIFPGAPSNALTIEGTTGDIGMGTTSPIEPLHVLRTDAARTTFQVENSNGSPQNTDLKLKNSLAEWSLRNNTLGAFVMNETADAPAELELDAAGNLTVLGVVAANGGTDTLPDYVFEPDYALMPLEELADFVRANKHLPRIPSQSEVNANNGIINMTEMQLRLLEKVEELTLYTLDQQQQILAQDTIIEDLRERLGSLEEDQD